VLKEFRDPRELPDHRDHKVILVQRVHKVHRVYKEFKDQPDLPEAEAEAVSLDLRDLRVYKATPEHRVLSVQRDLLVQMALHLL
jgi:hypothetical protein